MLSSISIISLLTATSVDVPIRWRRHRRTYWTSDTRGKKYMYFSTKNWNLTTLVFPTSITTFDLKCLLKLIVTNKATFDCDCNLKFSVKINLSYFFFLTRLFIYIMYIYLISCAIGMFITLIDFFPVCFITAWIAYPNILSK